MHSSDAWGSLAFLLVALIDSSSYAQLAQTGAGRGTVGSAPFAGALDVKPTATGCFSLQACSAAIAAAGTQKVLNVVRASDSHACDVIIATSGNMGLTANCGTGGDNGQSAASFLASTTGTVPIWSDQSGNGLDATCSPAPQLILTGGPSSLQPALVFSDSGLTRCTTAAVTSGNPVSISVVSVQSTSTAAGMGLVEHDYPTGIVLYYTNSAPNQMVFYDGTFNAITGITTGTWFALDNIDAGATPAMWANGVSVKSLTVTPHATVSASWTIGDFAGGGDNLNGKISELVIWPADTTSVAAALSANQRTRFGF